MTVTVLGPGAHVGRRGDCLTIKSASEPERVLSAEAVSELVLPEACGLTTDALHLCMENEIPLLLLDKRGLPYCEMNPFAGGGTPVIRRRQLALADSPAGVTVVRKIQAAKIGGRIGFLRGLRRNRRDMQAAAIEECISALTASQKKIESLDGDKVAEIRETLQGLEGMAGKRYFACLSALLPKAYRFDGRSQHPARDMFNALLNYACGVLYGVVKRNCYLAHLDPYIGIMHADAYNKPTLTYDLIEPYRHVAEKMAFKLCSKQKAKRDVHFDFGDGVLLSSEGKRLLLTEYYTTANMPSGKNQSGEADMEKEMLADFKRLAAYIKEV